MEQILTEIAKYFIIISIGIYTILCFSVFRYKNEYDRKGIYLRQNFFMVLLHFCSFISMYAIEGDIKYFTAYLLQQLGMLAIIVIYHFLFPTANRLIINNMCMLLTIGLIILTRISYTKAMRQFYIAMGAFAVTLVVPYFIKKGRLLRRFTYLYAVGGLVSLMAVLLFSKVINGSKLNISIANYTFQPSEYVKIIFVFAIAGMLYKSQNIKDILISASCAGAHVLLLVISKDLGSAIIFFVVYFAMLYVATHKLRYYLCGFVAAFFGCIIGYKLFSHVRVRVEGYLDPIGNITDSGYQIAQSLFAIGTGGWLGMGIGKGAPNTIPVVAADFIFAAICEEMGVIFGMCLILICLSCFIMFMNIAMRFEDKYYKLVATGLAVAYGFQVFLTIGGVIKFIPLTGVTLPLVSYGGTSVAVTCVVFAVIEGLYITKGADLHRMKKGITPEDSVTDETLEILDIEDFKK